VIYDDLAAELQIQPLPAQRTEEPSPARAPHDAMSCQVCQAWLAHHRDAGDT
jgi:hypothetical protein